MRNHHLVEFYENRQGGFRLHYLKRLGYQFQTADQAAAIMERMTAGKFRHVPVVDQGRLSGIVSIGDVVKHRLHEMERDSAAMRDYILTA